MLQRILITVFVVGALASCAAPEPTPAPTAAPKATQLPAATAAPKATTAPALTTPATGAQPTGDSVKFVLVAGKSEARYRVREQLAGVNLPSDAIGVTKDVSGEIIGKADGSVVKEQSKFRVDLNTLRSDRDQRDNFLRRSTLETNRYRYADFTARAIKGLAIPPPRSGEVAFQLIGDLTIKNVTKEVVWDVKGKIEGEEFTGIATTSFKFGYFNIEIPRVQSVLSIEDNIKLELDFVIRYQPG